MATRRPTTVYLWELAWILPSFAIPVGMLAAFAVTALGTGITVTGDQGQIDPRKVAGHPLFKELLGFRGMPRRTMIGQDAYMQPEWKALLPLVGIGGALLFASAVLYFVNMALTVAASRRVPQPAAEFADALSGPDEAPIFLGRQRPWLALTALMIAVAYGPTLVRLIATTPLSTPGFRVW
jgi:hypothetical protein